MACFQRINLFQGHRQFLGQIRRKRQQKGHLHDWRETNPQIRDNRHFAAVAPPSSNDCMLFYENSNQKTKNRKCDKIGPIKSCKFCPLNQNYKK